MVSSMQNTSMSETVEINPNCEVSTLSMGDEGNLIVVVDDFLLNSKKLVKMAEDQGEFVDEPDNYYPGQRADIAQSYTQALTAFFKGSIAQLFNAPDYAAPKVVESKFCLATKAPRELLSIQSIPHFDTSEDNQIAAVHYLCSPPFQGTSFYQHRSTGFEAITADRSKVYFKSLNREATTIGLPKPDYIAGDTQAFKRVAKIELKENRIIFYKSNVLHAGDIDAKTDLHPNPAIGRLTANSFIRM